MASDHLNVTALTDALTPEALQRIAGRYRALIQAAGHIVWTANAQGQIVEDIPLWRAYTGQSPGELMGSGWLDAVHPDDRARAIARRDESLRTRQPYETTMRLRRADGVYTMFLARGAPVIAPDGSVIEWVGICTDISALEEARAEAEAQASRVTRLLAEEQQARAAADALTRKMETTFAAMTEGVALYDAHGAIQYMNPAFKSILAQYARPDFDDLSLFDRLASFVPQDEAGEVMPSEQYPIVRLLRGEAIPFDAPVVMRIGGSLNKTYYMSISGAPIRDDAGAIIGAVAITRDVTKQRLFEKRTHAALNALLQMAETLVNPPTPEAMFARSGIMPIAGLEDDENTQVMNASATQLVYLIRTVLDCDVVGMVTVDAASEALAPVAVIGLTPEDEAQWRHDAPRTTLTKFVQDPAEAARLRAGEMVYWNHAHAAFTRLPHYGVQALLLAPMMIGDRLIGLMGIEHRSPRLDLSADEVALVRAVTQLASLVVERARLQHEHAEAVAKEGELRETNQQMTDFLSIVSHEIKTPLTSIKAAIQFAERKLKRIAEQSVGTVRLTPQEYAETLNLLARADSQVNVQNRLVEDLLDASRIQTGRLELRREPADLGQIVRTVVEEQRIVWENRAIILDPPDPPQIPITADAMRIGQVVANYLTNALKYSPAAMPVSARLQAVDGVARVSVTDRGPGLPPHELERVWERFHRAKGITVQSGSGVGLGLGLFICKSFIERHHGQVGVTSAPGQGSTFWFELPLTPMD